MRILNIMFLAFLALSSLVRADTKDEPKGTTVTKNADKPVPAETQWDSDTDSIPEVFLSKKWPTSRLTSHIEIIGASGKTSTNALTIKSGDKNIKVELDLSNFSDVTQHVIMSGLRLNIGKENKTSSFFLLPLSSMPVDIPPGGQAKQLFRLDSFNDTPAATYSLEPCVLCVPTVDNLLIDGGFEKLGTGKEQPLNQKGGWTLPADAPKGIGTIGLKSGAPLAELSNRIADWNDFTKIPFTNEEHFVTQGDSLLEASAPVDTVIGEQTVIGIKPGERYVAGVDSWNGRRVRVEVLDEKGTSISKVEQNFSGFFFHDNASNWRERVLGFRPGQGAAGIKLSLLAPQGKSWWDNGFIVPEQAVERAAVAPFTLTVSKSEANRVGDVVYLGEDRDTKGSWIGKYGQYAYILCAMSAPRDMVGGYAKPLKCAYDDMGKVYNNETIRVRGQDELRYAAWTGNPQDVQPRHWINLDAMRTDQERALENPQWGYRTSSSWDDHGETHPSDAWGNDLFVRLRLPAGSWRVSYYLTDWDWFTAPYPRKYRLSILNNAGNEVCTAQAVDLKEGVYKSFRMQGGQDIVLRIRKDFTINSIISGVFVDPLSPKIEPASTAPKVTGQSAERLSEVIRKWRTAAKTVDGFKAEEASLKQYKDTLVDGAGRAEAEPTMIKLGDDWFADGEYWRASVAYDLAPQDPKLSPVEASQAAERRAIQFRSVFPRYAEAQVHQAIAALNQLPQEERISYVRELASRLFDVALDDHVQSKGMERVPMILPKTAYSELESLVKYPNLTPTERAKMLAVVERNTWYTVGWQEVVNEGQRFWPSLTPKQRARLGHEFFADHIVRPMGVLAQSDNSYLGKVVTLVDAFAKDNPDVQDVAFAQYQLAQILYQQGQREQAIARCNAAMSGGPRSRPAILATSLLKKIGG